MITKNTINDLLITIINKVLCADINWLEEHEIDAINKSGYHILNYSIASKPNEYNRITRGLIIDKDGNLVTFPFMRFFNMNEVHADKVNINSSTVIEKLDGTLLCLSFDKSNKLIMSTRRMISEHDEDRTLIAKNFDGKKINFLSEFDKYIKHLSLSDKHYNLTLMFEAIITNRPVVTLYNDDALGLYLIGARDKNTFIELTELELDVIATEISAKRPRIFDTVKDFEQIIKMMSEFNEDYEGFVIRDYNTGERIKVKQESYLKRHKLIGALSVKNLLHLFIDGERSEIESYFPETVMLFDDIDTRINKIVCVVKDAIITLSNITNRKDYALCVMEQHKDISTFLFMLFGNDTKDIYTFVCNTLRTMTIKKALSILGYSDSE